MPPPYRPPLSDILGRIQGITPVTVKEDGVGAEWLHIKSSTGLSDSMLYGRLQPRWAQIVGPNGDSFALLLCRAGHKAGLFLHHLSTPDLRANFDKGCDIVDSWD